MVSYGATIWACTKAKRWGAAQRLFYRMEQDKVAPTLIVSRPAGGRLRTWRRWRRLRLCGRQVCNAVITSFASSDAQWREPLRIFNEMESRFKLKPGRAAVVALVVRSEPFKSSRICLLFRGRAEHVRGNPVGAVALLEAPGGHGRAAADEGQRSQAHAGQCKP